MIGRRNGRRGWAGRGGVSLGAARPRMATIHEKGGNYVKNKRPATTRTKTVTTLDKTGQN